MSIKQKIESDLKTAMLAGDKLLVNTLRNLKSSILYVEVAKNSRDEGLSDAEVIEVLSKESKKRQESADLYIQGGDQQRADAELNEKKLIDEYLPMPLSEEELKILIKEVIESTGAKSISDMGNVISNVKEKTQGRADGAVIAKIVKERLSQS